MADKEMESMENADMNKVRLVDSLLALLLPYSSAPPCQFACLET